jgi:hypothetical protein
MPEAFSPGEQPHNQGSRDRWWDETPHVAEARLPPSGAATLDDITTGLGVTEANAAEYASLLAFTLNQDSGLEPNPLDLPVFRSYTLLQGVLDHQHQLSADE